MKLFLPSARATNWLLIVGFCAMGYALYMRYLAIEQSTVGLACGAGLNTWLCFSRKIVIALYQNTVFGWTALVLAAINLVRPSLVTFGLGVAAVCLGIVLYNIVLSGLAIGLLILGFARPAPATA